MKIYQNCSLSFSIFSLFQRITAWPAQFSTPMAYIQTCPPPCMNSEAQSTVDRFHAFLCLCAFEIHVRFCMSSAHGGGRMSGHRIKRNKTQEIWMLVSVSLTPLDPPGDPGSPGLDATETETCWESLAEHNAKDSVKWSLQINKSVTWMLLVSCFCYFVHSVSCHGFSGLSLVLLLFFWMIIKGLDFLSI